MQTMNKFVILFLACVYTEVKSANILAVFPAPSVSHQIVFRRITEELINKGHNVTVITPDPAYPKAKPPFNLKEIDVHDISYGTLQKLFQENFTVKQLRGPNFSYYRKTCLLFGHVFKLQMQTPEVQNLIFNENNKYDLILIESVIRPALLFSHIFKNVPVILVSSMGGVFNNHDVIGSPTHPLLYPSSFRMRFYNLTLSEKFGELYAHFVLEYANYLTEMDENAMLKELWGPNVPNLKELYNNVDMLFLNIHPIWADNQPVPPGVVFMGGIHQLPQKNLPKDLESYLNSSKNGVIYVSFGTNVVAAMIPERQVKIIARVLSNLPYDVLWKWDKEELPGKYYNNTKISKWYPQSDLLKHPKIKLFVTQAGLQSTDEAITAGVPLIALPMLGEQWYNAEKYVKLGIGLKLDIEYLTEEQLKNAVETVINNPSYRSNINRLRILMRDQPETPLQRTMWWIEYVIRHGGAKQLRAPGANISYYEYFAVDVLFIIFLIVSVTIFLVLIVILFIFRFISKFLLSLRTCVLLTNKLKKRKK